PARVVVHVRNNQPGPHHRQKQHNPPPERANGVAHALDAFRPAFAHHLQTFPAPHRSRFPYFKSFDTTSSTVITPSGLPSSSTTVSIRKLYLSNSSNTSFSSAFGCTLNRGYIFNSFSGCSEPAKSNLATGTDPENCAPPSSSTIVSS